MSTVKLIYKDFDELVDETTEASISRIRNGIELIMAIDKKGFTQKDLIDDLAYSMRMCLRNAKDEVRVSILDFVFEQWKKSNNVTRKKAWRSKLRLWKRSVMSDLVNELVDLYHSGTNYLYGAFVRNDHNGITSAGRTIRNLRKHLVDFTLSQITADGFSGFTRRKFHSGLKIEVSGGPFVSEEKQEMGDVELYDCWAILMMEHFTVAKRVFYFKSEQLASFVEKAVAKNALTILFQSFLWLCQMTTCGIICQKDGKNCKLFHEVPLMLVVNCHRILKMKIDMGLERSKKGDRDMTEFISHMIMCLVSDYYERSEREEGCHICFEAKKSFRTVASSSLRIYENPMQLVRILLCVTRKCLLMKCSYGDCQKPVHLKRRKCKGCRFALYCDKQCQKRHWRTEHKDECKMLSGF